MFSKKDGSNSGNDDDRTNDDDDDNNVWFLDTSAILQNTNLLGCHHGGQSDTRLDAQQLDPAWWSLFVVHCASLDVVLGWNIHRDV